MLCNHREYCHNGHDRHGKQRFKCIKCGITWTDKRRDNRADKSKFIYSRDMLIDWLDGHSYRTLARNYKLSTYYVHQYINQIIELLPDFRQLIKTHRDCMLIEWVGIDAGYLASNSGKISYLLAVDLDTNTMVYFKEAKETVSELSAFLLDLKDMFPNLKGFTSDLCKHYEAARKRLSENYSVEFTHFYCKVHMFMSYRSASHGLPIAIGHRKYKACHDLMRWEEGFKTVIFGSHDDESLENNLKKLKLLKQPAEKYKKAIEHFEREYKQHIIKQMAYKKYHTNNYVESAWNLIKTKFKTARTLSKEKMELWFNLLVLRYHFNHISFDGTVIDDGKRFKFFEFSSFEELLNETETMYRAK